MLHLILYLFISFVAWDFLWFPSLADLHENQRLFIGIGWLFVIAIDGAIIEGYLQTRKRK